MYLRRNISIICLRSKDISAPAICDAQRHVNLDRRFNAGTGAIWKPRRVATNEFMRRSRDAILCCAVPQL